MPDNENLDLGGLDLSMLSGMLSNPEIMSKLSGVISSLTRHDEKAASNEHEDAKAASTTPDIAEKLSSVLENKELMSALPDVMTALAPMMSSGGGKCEGKGDDGSHKKESCDKRTALLLALKPYMSPRRREAIDYIIRINKLGNLIKTIT